MLDFVTSNWIEIVGACAGILYLYYEYNANIKIWPVGIVMSGFYTFVFIQAKFYAFAGINIYYILAAVYGWIMWYKSPAHKTEDKGIVRTPKKYFLPITGAIFILFVLISSILKEFTDSPVPYGDSFVTTLSIVSMWMLAHKFAEQWLLLVILNIVSVFLYFWQNLYPTSLMYLIYAVVSVMGYFKWKSMVKE